MKIKVEFTRKASKQFSRLKKDNKFLKRFDAWLASLEKSPENAHEGEVKNYLFPYQGEELKVYKKRIGKYRVIFAITNKPHVIIIKIKKREDAYKRC